MTFTFEVFEATFNGVDYLVVPKAALAGIYGPATVEPAAPLVAPERREKAARVLTPAKVKKEREKGPQAASDATERDAPGAVKEMILAELRKRPACSTELVDRLGKTSGQIYGWLKKMREAGEIETRDDADGVRKNFLVRAA